MPIDYRISTIVTKCWQERAGDRAERCGGCSIRSRLAAERMDKALWDYVPSWPDHHKRLKVPLLKFQSQEPSVCSRPISVVRITGRGVKIGVALWGREGLVLPNNDRAGQLANFAFYQPVAAQFGGEQKCSSHAFSKRF